MGRSRNDPTRSSSEEWITSNPFSQRRPSTHVVLKSLFVLHPIKNNISMRYFMGLFYWFTFNYKAVEADSRSGDVRYEAEQEGIDLP